MYALTKSIEINMSEAELDRLDIEIADCANTAELHRNKYRNAKIRRHRAQRQLDAATCVSPTYWDYLKICPDKKIAEHLRKERNYLVRELRAEARRFRNHVDEYFGRYNAITENLRRLKFKRANIANKSNHVDVFKVNDWEHELRLNSLYKKGSLKLRQHKYAKNKFKVSATFSPAIALSTDTVDEYPAIRIPRIIADFHINRFYNTSRVTFRAAAGSTRYRGFEGREVLHPHMTDATTPCLGDFGGPIYEALNDFDIPTAVTVLAMFMESYNPHDGAGRFAANWPKVQQHAEAA